MADHFKYRTIIHRPFADHAHIEWDNDGTLATVHFLAADETAIALTMSAATLALLREDIADALARKPQPAQHQ